MAVSCSIKFGPRSVKPHEINQVLAGCNKGMFNGCLHILGSLTKEGRTDWIISYYSKELSKAGVVYSVHVIKLNASGFTLGFAVGAKESAFSQWLIRYLTNEIALRCGGELREASRPNRKPSPVSPPLSVYLKAVYARLPHHTLAQHMLMQQAGSFPPEFPLKDHWNNVTANREAVISTARHLGLEVREGDQISDQT